jgi:hypothetical protein
MNLERAAGTTLVLGTFSEGVEHICPGGGCALELPGSDAIMGS